MKNLLFITHIKEDYSNGVWKKVNAQKNALIALGYDVDFVYESKEGFLVIKNADDEKKVKLPHRYMIFLFLSKVIRKEYDFVYYRKPHGGAYPLFSFMPIIKIKKVNKNAKIFMEYPTYPYTNEIKGWGGNISNLMFVFSMFLMKRKISKILYIGEGTDKISGITAEKINNGVDENSVGLLGTDHREKEEFVFAGIANLMFWHGYERLIYSLKEYKGSVDAKFYIVGDTEPEYSRLKKIVSENKLEKKVKFLGRLEEKELNDFLKSVSVCVDALGRHRSGNNVNSSIKSKEYAAMGIPFIKSHIDDSFVNVGFIYQVSADDNVFSIGDIIKWYNSLPNDFSSKEREYALDNFTWKNIMSSIIK